MGITGRYNFPGMQKAANFAIYSALAATSWGARILASPFKPAFTAALDLLDNFLINHGLIIINLTINTVDGKLDQMAFDSSMDRALNKLKMGRDKITAAQGKAIDDEVVAAFDKDADLNASASNGVPDVSSSPFRAGNNKTI